MYICRGIYFLQKLCSYFEEELKLEEANYKVLGPFQMPYLKLCKIILRCQKAEVSLQRRGVLPLITQKGDIKKPQKKVCKTGT
jgi:hypothetical protein